MSYAIYLRKSRADAEAEARGEGETLARHERALKELAVRNDYPIAQIYREIVSGESISNRPQMRQLLADVAAGKYQGVLVMEVERLARGDTMDQATVANTFRFSNTLIITPFKVYDPNDSMDEEYFEFSLFMSRREYKTIVRRMQTGRKLAAKEGKYIGSKPPYGYNRVKRLDGVWTLEVNPQQAPIVKQVFEQYANGHGSTRIATQLNAVGVPTQQGGRWTSSTVIKMIHNPVYIGYVTWDKRLKTVVGLEDGRKQYRRVRNSGATRVRGLHEPIISEDLFRRANDTSTGRSGRMPVRSEYALSNPLAGLVKCGLCGHSMFGMASRPAPNGGRYPYRITCKTQGCANVGCHLSVLEDVVLRTLEQWGAEYAGASETDIQSQQRLAIDLAKRQLEQLQSQRSKLCDYLERGIYDEDTYMQRSIVLADQIRAAQEALDAATAAVNINDTQSNIRAVAPLCASAAASYRMASTPEEKNKILRSVISRVVYTKNKRGNNRNDFRDQIRVEIYPAVLQYH